MARLTPYFSAYLIRDCKYAMSCVILLLTKNMAPFVTLLPVTSTITDEALYFSLFHSVVQDVLYSYSKMIKYFENLLLFRRKSDIITFVILPV